MLNYFVKFENELYKVVDGNSNRVVATFINEIDAHTFLRNLLGSLQPQYGMGMYPQMPMMPYPQMPMMPYPGQPMQQPQVVQGVNQNNNPSPLDSNANMKMTLDAQFDDSTIHIDGSNFLEDKLGTLLKLPPEVYAGSFDDTSLGETSAFKIKDMEQINFLENHGRNAGKK